MWEGFLLLFGALLQKHGVLLAVVHPLFEPVINHPIIMGNFYNNMIAVILESPQQTYQVGEILAQYQGQIPSPWLLNGELGSGKTTLTQGLAAGLGIRETVNSPTFSLVNQYELPTGGLFFHLDLYRLKSLDELFAIGIEDYLQPQALVVVEWAERFSQFFPSDAFCIVLSHQQEGRYAQIYFPVACAMLEEHFARDLKGLHVTVK